MITIIFFFHPKFLSKIVSAKLFSVVLINFLKKVLTLRKKYTTIRLSNQRENDVKKLQLAMLDSFLKQFRVYLPFNILSIHFQTSYLRHIVHTRSFLKKLSEKLYVTDPPPSLMFYGVMYVLPKSRILDF